jgi:hypothetical protein
MVTVHTKILMVYSILYVNGIYHDIHYLAVLHIPWYIPKVVYTTFGAVYTMGQPFMCLSLDRLLARSLSSSLVLSISSLVLFFELNNISLFDFIS